MQVKSIENIILVKGSVDAVVSRCKYVSFKGEMLPMESFSLENAKAESVHAVVDEMLDDGMKVLAVACKKHSSEVINKTDEEDLVLLGYLAFFDAPKESAKSAIVSILQENGHSVGFIGDGMNDLSAIVQSDVGISVDQASDVVKEASDVILLKKDLNVLEEGILEGQKAFANTRKYIKITASSNLGNIFSIVIASIFLPFLPMTSLQLLLLNLLYDMLCLVLPWDNVDEDIYQTPQEWSGRNLSRFMRCFGPISSVFDLITFAFLFFVICPVASAGNQEQFVALFQTGWFLESMWTQVLNKHYVCGILIIEGELLPFKWRV